MDLVSWTFGGNLPDPDKPILIDALSPSTSYSYNQIVSKTRQLIAGLRAQGIEPGDCVCVNCFNDLNYSVLYLGIIGAGAIFTGVNPAFTPNELSHHFSLTKPSLLIVEPKMLEKTLTAAKQAGIATDRIYVFDTETENPDPSILSWNALLENGEADWVTVESPHETVASYNSTSGTSGLPKAAMITHSYHVSQAASQCVETDYPRSRLLTLPPFHAFGSPILPSSIRQGIPTYIMRRYAEAPFLNAIAQYGISETYVPPPVLMALPKSELATREGLNSLRSIWMGGASVKFAQQKPLYDLLHEDACIRGVWGMTESGWITCVQDRTRREDDSVGQPLEGFEIRIVDEDGEPITEDHVSGEILARVPHPLLSYISNPVATANAFTPCGNYVCTGDIGYRVTDPETGVPSMFIVDRAKELIKVRGWQVSPTEVESELMQHPGIADAAVIGVKEADGVEEFARAYIVRKVVFSTADELLIDDKVLRTWLRERLAGYKVPAEFVFVPTVPRNGTGKILRRVLRETETVTKPAVVAPVHKRVDSAMSGLGVSNDPLGSNPVASDDSAAPIGHALSTVRSQVEMGAADAEAEAPVATAAPTVAEEDHLPITSTPPAADRKVSVTTTISTTSAPAPAADADETSPSSFPEKTEYDQKKPASIRRKLKKLASKKDRLVSRVMASWTQSMRVVRCEFASFRR
ncbi:Acyl-CoA ligase azaF [Lasiodiplodia hormozganensis]|uniref:Acyl-CoA ligase azaF n=1 Tax=Lasiodiplodia hormozganensis TaxID=869390 RepID=A0AA39XPR7_9PEZI|nr:Acyl-CoA ligase azaF [Lasiodiplodia hormozganensis]